MSASISSLWSRLFGKQSVGITMVGLDAGGKTTILYQLKLGKVVTTIPTIGFNVETIEYNNISFTVWGLHSGDKLANKQDRPNAMSADELSDKLNLKEIQNHKWHIQATSAIQGKGLYEGLDWLSNELANKGFTRE